MLFSWKCWFSWKWPPEPIKTLGNTWYFRHGRKVDFLWEKIEFQIENVKFPKKCKSSEYFLFSVNFPIMPNLQEPEKCDFCVFTKKVRISLKWLKYWKFHENGGNLVKSAAFPPMSKIPSITKRFYRYFRYFSRKYLKFGDFLEI